MRAVPRWPTTRRGDPTDWYEAADSMIWDRVPRETAWGRSVVVHDFDRERAAQHRGFRLYPQARLVHQRQHGLAEELKIGRKIEERDLDAIAAGTLKVDQFV